MQITALSCGRPQGNSAALADYFLQQLTGFATTSHHIQLATAAITPCGNCEYRCFSGSCPYDDEADAILSKLYSSDITALFVPTYGGLPPATWVALMQRRQSMDWKRQNPRQFLVGVVLANAAGATSKEHTPKIIEATVADWGAAKTAYMQVEPREHQQSSLTPDLILAGDVQRKLSGIVDKIYVWHQGRTANQI
ncbi:MAG: hypothetical protein FH749_02705 [Firmicutes bacterium]|nr:hypothetical protein [Bacillota bacterium]